MAIILRPKFDTREFEQKLRVRAAALLGLLLQGPKDSSDRVADPLFAAANRCIGIICGYACAIYIAVRMLPFCAQLAMPLVGVQNKKSAARRARFLSFT